MTSYSLRCFRVFGPLAGETTPFWSPWMGRIIENEKKLGRGNSFEALFCFRCLHNKVTSPNMGFALFPLPPSPKLERTSTPTHHTYMDDTLLYSASGQPELRINFGLGGRGDTFLKTSSCNDTLLCKHRTLILTTFFEFVTPRSFRILN